MTQKQKIDERIYQAIKNCKIVRYESFFIQACQEYKRLLDEHPIPAEPQESELQQLMNDIRKWSDDAFGKENESLRIFYHLQKEVEELISAIKKSKGKTISTVLFEYADCLMLLLNAASAHGYTSNDLLLALRDKLELNKNRKWGKPDENGVVEHIREKAEPGQLTREELKKSQKQEF